MTSYVCAYVATSSFWQSFLLRLYTKDLIYERQIKEKVPLLFVSFVFWQSFVFWNRVSHRLDWPQIFYVGEDDLELLIIWTPTPRCSVYTVSSAWDSTKGFLHARPTLYQLRNILSPKWFYLNYQINVNLSIDILSK